MSALDCYIMKHFKVGRNEVKVEGKGANDVFLGRELVPAAIHNLMRIVGQILRGQMEWIEKWVVKFSAISSMIHSIYLRIK